MITENKDQEDQRNFRGLKNDVPQNSGLDQDDRDASSIENSNNETDKPVKDGAMETPKFDPHLEEQWLAVRDEYLSHYPELEEKHTEYKKGSFHTIIDSLAEKQQRTPKQIRKEIMEWTR